MVSTPEVFPCYGGLFKVEQAADPRKESVDQLLEGEVDAIITDISDEKLFGTFESNPNLKRLFPNYIEMDEQLYRDTGIYTPMHQMVMSKKLDRECPDLARKIYLAFEEAKRIAYHDVLSDQAGFSVVYLRERMNEQRLRWGDPFKYGVSANKSAIDAFIAYNVEQGMIRAAPTYEQIFAAGTLET